MKGWNVLLNKVNREQSQSPKTKSRVKFVLVYSSLTICDCLNTITKITKMGRIRLLSLSEHDYKDYKDGQD